MKSGHPRLTLLGNNAGRNLGDAAIMSSILESFSRELPQAEFFIPSTSPDWVSSNYGQRYNVRAVNVMPWTLSLRLLGLPTALCLAKSDVALICDGIIFGKKLFNPAFNYLITLIFVVPLAKLLGCKVICYSCGIGPFPSKLSEKCAQFVLNLCDLVIMRENDSKALAEKIGCSKPITVTGDAAFINPVSDRDRALEIMRENQIDPTRPLLGVNVNSYLDSWLEKSERTRSREQLLADIASGVRKACEELNANIQVVCFSTHPMDEPAVITIQQATGAKQIFNRKYLSHDIQAVMRECQLFLGMRFHSLVLASAVEVPIVGLVYMPKVRGFMRQMGCEEFALELSQATPERIAAALCKAWKERAKLKTQQKSLIDTLKSGARNAATQVREIFFPHASPI